MAQATATKMNYERQPSRCRNDAADATPLAQEQMRMFWEEAS